MPLQNMPGARSHQLPHLGAISRIPPPQVPFRRTDRFLWVAAHLSLLKIRLCANGQHCPITLTLPPQNVPLIELL
jgi:hypothetical protein